MRSEANACAHAYKRTEGTLEVDFQQGRLWSPCNGNGDGGYSVLPRLSIRTKTQTQDMHGHGDYKYEVLNLVWMG